jgi:hypothetical protein
LKGKGFRDTVEKEQRAEEKGKAHPNAITIPPFSSMTVC